MKLFYDRDLGYLIQSFGSKAKLSVLEAIRTAAGPLELQFTRGTVLDTLPNAAVVGAVVKEVGSFDGDSIVPACTLIKDSNGLFVGVLNLESVVINTALAVDGNPSNDITSVIKTFAIGFSADGIAEPVSSQPIALTISNNPYRGTETTPAALPTPDGEWVAHGHAQTLTDEQKAQARSNIGVSVPTNTPVADAPARLALTGLKNGDKATQADTRHRWEVIDSTLTNAGDAAGWQDLGEAPPPPPPPLATHVSDVSSWNVSGGSAALSLIGSNAFLSDAANCISLNTYGGSNSGGNTVFALNQCPSLTSLSLYDNSTSTSLDISTNTLLTTLYCPGNNLTSLDVSTNTLLTTLYCGANALVDVDSIFIALDGFGLSGGTINCSGGTNAAPTGASTAARANLLARGWTLITN